MRIIDRYLLRQFVHVFLICFISLDGLYVVFDAFSNLDEFLYYAEKDGGGLLSMMGEFYAYRTVAFFEQISSMLTMIAGMFTVTWIQRHNELTALMAAGVSRTRIIVPIVVAAACTSLGASAAREFVIPQLADELGRDAKNLRGEAGLELKPRLDFETNVLLHGKVAYANEQRINEPSFMFPRSLYGQGRQLAAENAYYFARQADRPAGYLLRGVIRPQNLAEQPSLEQNGSPLLITPRDADWLKPDECFLVSNVNFDQLTGGEGMKKFSSTRQLIAALSDPSLGLAGDYGADVRVKIHARIIQPLMDMTLLFLGLPLVLNGTNRNVFVAIGLCGAVCTAFMLVAMGFQYLGAAAMLRPALAAWAPLVIFVPIAVGMFDRIEY
ncbi:MAG TPA: LptF/LptG family permease [Pirellulales bacterium]|nr:LptF/LptG family permease [Pirellulales bacterium]